MRAAEALMLGSLTVKPVQGHLHDGRDGGCALGMINAAVSTLSDQNAWRHVFPWMAEYGSGFNLPCGCAGKEPNVESVVIHLFDVHVTGNKCPDPMCPCQIGLLHERPTWSIAKLAEWLESVDPTPRESEKPAFSDTESGYKSGTTHAENDAQLSRVSRMSTLTKPSV